MEHALSIASQDLANELYLLLEEIDPARWREEAEAAVRQRVASLRERLQAMSAEASEAGDARAAQLRERLAQLRVTFDRAAAALPSRESLAASVNEHRAAWADFQREVQPAYEALAASLRSMTSVAPRSLRPTNYRRNVFHVTCGVTVVTLTELLPTRGWLIALPLAFAVFAWGCEISRRIWPSVNDRLMRLFGGVAHALERHRVNSSTWFVTALVLLGLFAPRFAAATGIAVLGLADPAAALVGRRFGRTKIHANRSLEGTLTFFVVAFLAAMAVLTLRHPAPLGALALTAAAAAFVGALTELYTDKLDDNFTIPLAAAAAAGVVGHLVGIQ